MTKIRKSCKKLPRRTRTTNKRNLSTRELIPSWVLYFDASLAIVERAGTGTTSEISITFSKAPSKAIFAMVRQTNFSSCEWHFQSYYYPAIDVQKFTTSYTSSGSNNNMWGFSSNPTIYIKKSSDGKTWTYYTQVADYYTSQWSNSDSFNLSYFNYLL